MAIVVVTGSAGLIGSETVKRFHAEGYDVIGVDNDMRAYFFGSEASTAWNRERLIHDLPRYQHFAYDIRDFAQIESLFKTYAHDIVLIVHAAAQPSHDWAAREPFTDFTINANGTLNLLEATRRHCPEAVFIFTSTNKVYGDSPNALPLIELAERWEVDPAHPYATHGIDEAMSIDKSKHSLFGASKVAADVLVQEYGRYFGLKTGIFRGGCLTGPSHSGAELHGFLAYLTLRAVRGQPYTIYGYQGKQVRDNIHSKDLIEAFWCFFQHPRVAEVYNMGGSRHSNVSMLEAIRLLGELGGYRLHYTLSDTARSGDHIWYVSDVRRFQAHYPAWQYHYDLETLLRELIEQIAQRVDVG
jgi:CDP-paratose 2-epimerase